MSRYIDIEPIEKEIERELTIGEIKILSEHQKGALDVYDAIKKTPTADVVEVVRCKDCKFSKISIWRNGTSHYACGISIYRVNPNDYCCRGEKTTDKEKEK